MGADEPWENSDGDSGPMLERILPDCERGRMERRLIHDPLEEIESRGFSVIGWVVKSAGRFQD